MIERHPNTIIPMALGVHGDCCAEIEGLKGWKAVVLGRPRGETDAVTCGVYIMVLIRTAGVKI
jgi:hypothetical protein